jgi:phage replication-related protein YjqB (UPF0714/DUF867 family)
VVRRDRYSSFANLSERASEGIDYRIHLRDRQSRISIVAPHGGGIEPGTSEVAAAIAGATLSFYCFNGIKYSRNSELHITSVRFDEPRCEKLVRSSDTVVTVHACGARERLVYVGGLHAVLKAAIVRAMIDAGFEAAEDCTHHSGEDPRNLCNRGRDRRGVQLELSEGLRRRMFASLTRRGRTRQTSTFLVFTTAVQEAINGYLDGWAAS